MARAESARTGRPWLAIAWTALPPGLYVAAATQGVAAISWTGVPLISLLCAWLTGSSVYLLDRVKPIDRLVDPADRRANPARFAFVTLHAGVLRRVNLVLAILAIATGAAIDWLVCLAVIAGHVVVLGYAHRPARRDGPRRLKDVFILKSLLVGAGIAGFASLLVLVSSGWGPLSGAALSEIRGLLPAGLFMGLVVAADAALCDLDDVHADTFFRTNTLAVRIGSGPTRVVVSLVYASAMPVLFMAMAPDRQQVLGAILMLEPWLLAPVSGLLLAWFRRGPIRRAVDTRLVLVAIVSFIAIG